MGFLEDSVRHANRARQALKAKTNKAHSDAVVNSNLELIHSIHEQVKNCRAELSGISHRDGVMSPRFDVLDSVDQDLKELQGFLRAAENQMDLAVRKILGLENALTDDMYRFMAAAKMNRP